MYEFIGNSIDLTDLKCDASLRDAGSAQTNSMQCKIPIYTMTMLLDHPTPFRPPCQMHNVFTLAFIR